MKQNIKSGMESLQSGVKWEVRSRTIESHTMSLQYETLCPQFSSSASLDPSEYQIEVTKQM